MRIGIMGGTFNPPHIGHLNAAREAQEKLSLDSLILIPTGLPPHKELAKNSATKLQRLEMTRLCAKELSATVSDIEIFREGKSYTVDTLRELRKLYPNDELWLIIGTDMFMSLEDWHKPQLLFSLANIAAVAREEADVPMLLKQRDLLCEKYGVVCEIIDTAVITISSSELRDGENKEKLIAFLPDSVREYVEKNKLYGF